MDTMASRTIKSLADLRPAPYNPREISKEALEGLGHSLDQFGDISGIVWNKRTGHLVAGHQRVEALRAAEAEWKNGALVVGQKKYPVRIVDWDRAKERAANVAANNQFLTGEFTDSLEGLLAELKTDFTGFEALRLDELAEEMGSGEETLMEIDQEIRAYKMIHVLLSFPPDLAGTVLPKSNK